MNPPEIAVWLRFSGVLALEIFVVLALALALGSIVKSSFGRRFLWQAALFCSLLLVLADATGFGRGLANWLAGKPPAEKKIISRIVSPEEQFQPQTPTPFLPLASNEKSSLATGAWWPGILWALGFTLVFSRILFTRTLFFTLIRQGLIPENDLQSRVKEISGRLGLHRKIRLLQSGGLTSPFAFGIFKPTIVLPPNFSTAFTRLQQDAMLTHELAHLSARDPLWYLIADLASAFLWWHPLVWWARRRLHAASELAADEATAILENGPGTLAECLLHLSRQFGKTPAVGSLGVMGFRSEVGQRVERLLNLPPQNQPMRRKPPVFKAIFTFLLIGVLVITSGWIQNGGGVREKTWRSALHNSWSDSLGSTLLLAALNNNTAEEMPSPSILQSAAEPIAANPAKEAILIEGKFFALPISAADDSAFTAEAAFYDQAEEKRLIENWKAKGARSIGAPRFINSDGVEAKLSSTQARTNANGQVVADGIQMSVLARLQNEAITLDLNLIVGEMIQDQPVEGSSAQRKISLTVPKEKRTALYISPKSQSGTNYLVIVAPKRITQEEGKKAFPKKEAKFENVLEIPKNLLPEENALLSARDEFADAATQLADFKKNLITAEKRMAEAKSEEEKKRAMAIYYGVQTQVERLSAKASPQRTAEQQTSDLRQDLVLAQKRLQEAQSEMEQKRLREVIESLQEKIIKNVEATLPTPAHDAADAPQNFIAPTALFTRNYKVDPGLFIQALQSLKPGFLFDGKDTGRKMLQELLLQFFANAGAELNPPKSIFFNDRNGILLVRATLADLQIIEQAIQALNTAPPQVRIQARFVEINESAAKMKGFDWLLGGTGATFVTNTVTTVATNPLALASNVNASLSTNLNVNVTAVLTEPMFRMVMKNLEKHEGVEVLTSPEVTTLSGRQAQMAMWDVRTVVTGLNQVTGKNGVATNEYETKEIKVGPSLDVIPDVSPDGYMIRMTLIGRLTEFLGYEEPDKQLKKVSPKATLPLPKTRVRQATTMAAVFDGQTVVLGGLTAVDSVKMKDKVPVLGDIPLLGRLFRGETQTSQKRNLVLFVTPTVIDPAGNRVHTEEEISTANNRWQNNTSE